jgi:class 3 adenylate cyclase
VNTASRMESTGAPMKIQISADTYQRLKAVGGFHMTERGEQEVKGKGKMKTYFLNGKEDCPYKLPE